MKKRYAAGGIRTARQVKASEGLVAAKDFSRDAGFPLFAKPDVGVGAGGAHKIESLEALEHFFATTPCVDQYVIEEFVTGDICTYDAVINSKGQPLVESMCVCPPSIADIVNERLDSTYFVEQHMSENLLLLVAALVGDKWRDIYSYALEHDFRFLSYGDSSLLIPHPLP